MKSRGKIYGSVALAVSLLLLLLWVVFSKDKTEPTAMQENVAVEEKQDSLQVQPEDTATFVINRDTVADVVKAASIPKKKLIPEKEVVSKATEETKREEPAFTELALTPLDAQTLLAVDKDEFLVEIHPVEIKQQGSRYEWKADTLPVKKGIDILRIKKVGRFDRGIVNYRFMPKGQTMFGLDASFWDFGSEDSKLLFAYLDNFTFNAHTVSVNPFLGYFYKDNQAIGMKWGYRQISGSLGNASIKIDDDVNFTIKDLGLKEEIYSCTFFHRSYIGLDEGKRFGLFNETSLRLGYGKSVFTRGSSETLKETTTKVLEAQLGISPGLAVFIMPNVSVECSIGVMGLKYRQEKQTNTLGETGQRLNGGANFKINLFDINLGLIISL